MFAPHESRPMQATFRQNSSRCRGPVGPCRATLVPGLTRDRSKLRMWNGPGPAAHRSARAARCTASGTPSRKDLMIKPRRIGHATFETADLEKAIAYYTDTMGLVLAARDKERAY